MTKPRIHVERKPPPRKDEEEFVVTIHDGAGHTAHTVRVRAADHQRLSGGRLTPEELVVRSFEFLLAREPKEAILREFNLAVISRYFPEYEREITSG